MGRAVPTAGRVAPTVDASMVGRADAMGVRGGGKIPYGGGAVSFGSPIGCL